MSGDRKIQRAWLSEDDDHCVTAVVEWDDGSRTEGTPREMAKVLKQADLEHRLTRSRLCLRVLWPYLSA